MEREEREAIAREEELGLEITGEEGEGVRNMKHMYQCQRERDLFDDHLEENRDREPEDMVEEDGRNEIERRLLEYKEAARDSLVAKSKEKNVTVFAPRDVRLLRTPLQLRLNTESSRILVRNLAERYPGRYSLSTRWGRLKGLYAHSAINPIAKWTIFTDAAYIPTYLTRYDEGGNIIEEREEIPLITLNVAVQKDNGNRSSVSSTQKQKTKERARV